MYLQSHHGGRYGVDPDSSKVAVLLMLQPVFQMPQMIMPAEAPRFVREHATALALWPMG